MRRTAPALALILLAATGARAEWCPTPPAGSPRPSAGTAACKPDERLRPYEPGAERREDGRGFVRVGPDTEIRVGGRVQMEYGLRR